MYILLYLSINIDMTIIQICVKLYVYMMNSYILSVVQTDMNRYNNINILIIKFIIGIIARLHYSSPTVAVIM